MSDRNYRRFYASFNTLPGSFRSDEFKKEIVRQYTWGRTDSLKEMTDDEYFACCYGLESIAGRRDQLRNERSSSLKLMQKLGIDTTDWTRVNAFCQDARISGKPFAHLSIEEHETLQKKLRSIERHGGLKPKKPCADAQGTVGTVISLPISGNG